MNTTAANTFPRAERIALALYALAAELVFVLVGMLVIAPLLVLQAAFFGHSIERHWVVILVLLLLAAMWWWTRPHTVPEGRRIARKQAPALFAALDRLALKMDAPRIHALVLDDRLNAAAHEVVSLFGLVGTRRTLVLGVPLLQLFTRSELLAVVAHELGHFSRQHGRLGHWIYNVRSRWAAAVQTPPEQDTGIERLHRIIARAFLPHFIRRSSAWSRACEYEADGFAAQACGSAALAQALTRMAALNGLLITRVEQALRAMQFASPDAPQDYWDVVRACALQAGSAGIDAALQAARMSAPDPRDTHPPRDDRLRAIGVLLQPGLVWNEESAGAELLDAQV